MNLQITNLVIEKLTYLQNILQVRHGIMIVGKAKSGKSSVVSLLLTYFDLAQFYSKKSAKIEAVCRSIFK